MGSLEFWTRFGQGLDLIWGDGLRDLGWVWRTGFEHFFIDDFGGEIWDFEKDIKVWFGKNLVDIFLFGWWIFKVFIRFN